MSEYILYVIPIIVLIFSYREDYHNRVIKKEINQIKKELESNYFVLLQAIKHQEGENQATDYLVKPNPKYVIKPIAPYPLDQVNDVEIVTTDQELEQEEKMLIGGKLE